MTDPTTTGPDRQPGGAAPLGDRTVARIGYGALQLHRLHEHPDDARDLLRRALDRGVDHVDTAQFYGDGFVNGVIRDAVRPSDAVTVVTKIGADPQPDGPVPMRLAQRPEELRASVEDNLRTLGVDAIPVVNLRRMDSGPRVPGPAEQDVDLDDQLEVMVAMRQEGLIGAIGLSSVTLDVLRRALPAGIVCVQNAYSLVDRSDEPLLELCTRERIGWVPYFPLGGALPGFAKVTDQAEVQRIAEEVGATPSQVGLAWLLQHAPDVLLIPGTASVEHLDANLAVADVDLSDDQVTRLDEVDAA